MGLGDVVGASGLSFYPQVALVIFFLVFLGVAAYLLLRRDRQGWERASRLPLEDDAALPGEPRSRSASEGGESHGRA